MAAGSPAPRSCSRASCSSRPTRSILVIKGISWRSGHGPGVGRWVWRLLALRCLGPLAEFLLPALSLLIGDGP